MAAGVDLGNLPGPCIIYLPVFVGWTEMTYALIWRDTLH